MESSHRRKYLLCFYLQYFLGEKCYTRNLWLQLILMVIALELLFIKSHLNLIKSEQRKVSIDKTRIHRFLFVFRITVKRIQRDWIPFSNRQTVTFLNKKYETIIRYEYQMLIVAELRIHNNGRIKNLDYCFIFINCVCVCVCARARVCFIFFLSHCTGSFKKLISFRNLIPRLILVQMISNFICICRNNTNFNV